MVKIFFFHIILNVLIFVSPERISTLPCLFVYLIVCTRVHGQILEYYKLDRVD